MLSDRTLDLGQGLANIVLWLVPAWIVPRIVTCVSEVDSIRSVRLSELQSQVLLVEVHAWLLRSLGREVTVIHQVNFRVDRVEWICLDHDLLPQVWLGRKRRLLLSPVASILRAQDPVGDGLELLVHLPPSSALILA